MMPDRDDVFVGVPCGYGVADSLAYLSLARIAGRGFFDPDHHLYVLHGCSDIQAARFTIMDAFKSRSECNWLLMLDADIGYRPEDVELLFDGDELAVCAEYRKKEENYRVAQFGLGFAIVHRDVFKAMDALETDGQPWVPQGVGVRAGRVHSGRRLPRRGSWVLGPRARHAAAGAARDPDAVDSHRHLSLQVRAGATARGSHTSIHGWRIYRL
jgi:hypothetical protein